MNGTYDFISRYRVILNHFLIIIYGFYEYIYVDKQLQHSLDIFTITDYNWTILDQMIF